MDITWAMVLVGLGLIGIVLVQGTKLITTKPKQRKLYTLIAVGVLVFGGLPALGVYNYGFVNLNNQLPLAVGGGAVQDEVVVQANPNGCLPGSPDGITVKLSSVDQSTDADTGGTIGYRVNGGTLSSVTSGGTFEASGNDVVEIMYENGTSTGSYYSLYDKVVLPCDKSSTEYKGEVYANGTLTINVFDDDGAGALNGVARNVTLGAGSTVTLDFEMKPTNKAGFPHGGVIFLEGTDSKYDQQNMYIDLAGQRLNSRPTGTAEKISNVSNVEIAFEVPKDLLIGANTYEGSIFVDADDNNDPAWYDDLNMTFRPYNYYFNEDEGRSFNNIDYEDEDDVFTYGMEQSFIIHVD